MKHNRSMKELQLDKHLFNYKQDNPQFQPFKSPTNFKHIMIDTKTKLHSSKNSLSQKQLLFPNAQYITTNKYIPTKNMHKHNHSILTPSNKNNLYPQQPKRPRILSKVRRSNNFNDQFKLGKVLGKGKFGNVQMAQHNITGSLYAVKQISLQKVSQKLIQRLIAQIKIQFFLKHQNCLQLYKFYKEKNTLYLILELGEYSLFDKLRQKKCFSQNQTAYYIRQTINALMYLHENGIIHRDLKPQNIVLSNNTVKLADFGWSIYMGKTKRKTFCGTLDYICPQIVMGSQYDEMVDVWSVGVLCYELCTGHAPFQSSKSRQQTYHKILNIDLKFPKFLTKQAQDFIQKLLVRKPEERMSLQDCLEHPWLKKYQ